MQPSEFTQKLQSSIDELEWKFAEEQDQFILTINSNSVAFNKCVSGFDVEPNEWLRTKHNSKDIHEPGMVATLVFLSTLFKDRIIFYDVGALFGYFSIIAKTFFRDCKCVLVEGNPLSSRCIPKLAAGLEGMMVKNVLVGSNNITKNYWIDSFNFFEVPNNPIWQKFKFATKNGLKRIINLFGAKKKIRIFHTYKIQQVTFPEIFNNSREPTFEIFKLDTEGYQSVFLPPHIDEFCDRKPIILMEFDHPHMMANFGTTNDKMLQLFIDRNYLAFWMNHRRPGVVEQISEVKPEHDMNSLCVLLPRSLIETL